MDHQKAQVLKCCFCEFKANVYCMSLHLKKHRSKNPFNCLLCSFSADQETTLRSHIERVHVKHSRKSNFMKHQALAKRLQGRTENRNGAKKQALFKHHQGRSENQNGSNKQDLVKYHEGRSENQNGSNKEALVKYHRGRFENQNGSNKQALVKCHQERFKIDHEASSYEHNRSEVETIDLSGSASPSLKKIFKCEMCTFKALNELLVNLHAAEKHHVALSSEWNQIKAETPGSSRLVSPQHREIFKCEKCAFATPKKPLLERHAAKHLIDPTFICTHCGFREINSVKFSKHLASNHSSKRKAFCCFCSYSSPTFRNLTLHLAIHRPVHMADCPECEMSFTRNSRLNHHFRKHHMKGKKNAGEDLLQATREESFVSPKSVITMHASRAVDHVAFAPPPVTHVTTPIRGSNTVTAAKEKQIPGPIKPVVNVPSKPFYQCSSCNFSTKRKDLLRRHVAKHLLLESYLVCPMCEFAESSAYSFVAHLLSHESRYRLECCFCEHRVKKPKELRRHVEIHRALHFYDCPVCGKSYRQFVSLRKHCKEAHVKNVQCPDCGKLTTKVKLHSHLGRHKSEKILRQKRQGSQDPKHDQIHVDPNPTAADDTPCSESYPQNIYSENSPLTAPSYLCSSCDYATNIESLHRRHVAKHDMEEAILVCPICQFKTSELTSFATHLMSLHDFSNNCCFCEFKTYCKSNLVRHLGSHRSVHFKDCAMCERSYSHQASLNKHVSKYHIQKNECPDCGERMTYFELIKHSKIHENVAPYNHLEIDDPSVLRCYHCQYTTAKKSLLRRHAVKHLMDTRIVCGDCDFAETNAREFAKHCISCLGGSVCSLCPYSTNSVNNLSCHVEIHRIVSLYDCAKCEFSSTTRGGLREHNKNMHVARHQCNYCDKTMSRYRLNRHKLKHLAPERTPNDTENSSDVQPLLDEPSANQAMSSSVDIKAENDVPSIALESARGQKNLLCGYCSFNTDAQSSFEEHMAIHIEQEFPCVVKSEPYASHIPADGTSGQRRLLCGYCDFSTDVQSMLEDHMNKHGSLASVKVKREPNPLIIVPEFIALAPNLPNSVLDNLPKDDPEGNPLDNPTASRSGSEMDIEYF